MTKFNITILTLGTLLLSGCIVSALNLGGKTVLEVKFDGAYDNYIVKMNSGLKGYCSLEGYRIWGFSCHYNNPPQRLNIEYAKWDITNQQYHQLPTGKKRIEIIQNTAQSLPQSAWRTYTIYPKQLLEKAQSVPPSNEPASQKPQHLRTTVTVTLYIDGNGNVRQEIKREYVKIGNPYA